MVVAAAWSGLRDSSAAASGRRTARISPPPRHTPHPFGFRRGEGLSGRQAGAGGDRLGWLRRRPRRARAPGQQAASRSPWSAAGTPRFCLARCSGVCFSQVRRARDHELEFGGDGQPRGGLGERDCNPGSELRREPGTLVSSGYASGHIFFFLNPSPSGRRWKLASPLRLSLAEVRARLPAGCSPSRQSPARLRGRRSLLRLWECSPNGWTFLHPEPAPRLRLSPQELAGAI